MLVGRKGNAGGGGMPAGGMPGGMPDKRGAPGGATPAEPDAGGPTIKEKPKIAVADPSFPNNRSINHSEKNSTIDSPGCCL